MSTTLLPHSYPDVSQHLAALLESYHRSSRHQSEDLIRRAFDLASKAHAKQRRRSGELYIHHPLAVAQTLADLGFDDTVIAAALLHDVLEDTQESSSRLKESFGTEVTRLVESLTKLDKLKLADRTVRQVSSLRKMLISMASDVRVLIIKFADRLHNMETIGALPPQKQQLIAGETLQVYVPLAERLGMETLKSQLEELAFAVLHPKWYGEIDHLVEERAPERELYLTQVIAQIDARLGEVLVNAEVTGRPKHLWSIFDKMQKKQLEFDEIYDLIGIRIVVDSVQDCYAALGTVHAIWKPAQGRFKDYISMPKFNLYQSLHTTVVGPGGKLLEVQIRTHEMHQRAEQGVAAHWDYKETNITDELLWLSRLMDWTQDADEADTSLARLTTDLSLDEVYVFTPRGMIVTLPSGATPVDFAYAIHTEVGHSCIGAKINGRLSALNSKLTTGDTVEIFTSKPAEEAEPSQDWLSFVVTHRARNHIRQWYARKLRSESEARTPDAKPAGAAPGDAKPGDADKASAMPDHDRPGAPDGDPGDPEPDELDFKTSLPRDLELAASRGVHVEGQSDMLVRLSKCCMPVPFDDIIGFVTRGRGVSVHRSDCSNAVLLSQNQSERCIDVDWNADISSRFTAVIEVRAFDRKNLLADVANVLSEQGLNITSVDASTTKDSISTMQFCVELADDAQIKSLIQRLRRINYVYTAKRVSARQDSSDAAAPASAQPEPGSSTPTQPEPAQPAPVQPEPAQPEPEPATT